MLMLPLQRIEDEIIRCVGLPATELLGQLAPQNVRPVSFGPGRGGAESVFFSAWPKYQ